MFNIKNKAVIRDIADLKFLKIDGWGIFAGVEGFIRIDAAGRSPQALAKLVESHLSFGDYVYVRGAHSEPIG